MVKNKLSNLRAEFFCLDKAQKRSVAGGSVSILQRSASEKNQVENEKLLFIRY